MLERRMRTLTPSRISEIIAPPVHINKPLAGERDLLYSFLALPPKMSRVPRPPAQLPLPGLVEEPELGMYIYYLQSCLQT